MRHLSNLSWQTLLGLVLALALLNGCNRGAKEGAMEAPKNDKRWPQYIAEHSAGLQSRSSQIRLRFVSDVVTEAHIGQPLDGVLESDPLIKGSAVFNNPRELLFHMYPETQSRNPTVEGHACGVRDYSCNDYPVSDLC